MKMAASETSFEQSVILIDNFDSFTFNIAQMVGEVNGKEAIVFDNAAPWRKFAKSLTTALFSRRDQET
ncbi:hypothetical protein AAFG13_35995 [Bradyrhizobium sp. B124]|uniref:hypothetical protein n=1 Tax=Bradyrhizobium sp. B124 TaxID=3140245 RepID=UPI003182CA3C